MKYLPWPCILSSSHWPSYSSVSALLYLPYPWYMFSFQLPSYTSPHANVNLPAPERLSFSHCPVYSVRVRVRLRVRVRVRVNPNPSLNPSPTCVLGAALVADLARAVPGVSGDLHAGLCTRDARRGEAGGGVRRAGGGVWGEVGECGVRPWVRAWVRAWVAKAGVRGVLGGER